MWLPLGPPPDSSVVVRPSTETPPLGPSEPRPRRCLDPVGVGTETQVKLELFYQRGEVFYSLVRAVDYDPLFDPKDDSWTFRKCPFSEIRNDELYTMFLVVVVVAVPRPICTSWSLGLGVLDILVSAANSFQGPP